MTTGPDIKTLKAKARRLSFHAQILLLWEKYIPALALPLALWAGFLIAAFSGIWERFGDPWRLIALAVALYFTVRAILQIIKLKPPRRSQARRRVERDNSLSHRPLDTLYDAPALGSAGWQAHQARAKSLVSNLHRAKSRKVLAKLDHYRLRFVLIIGLVLALMIGTSASFERLRLALLPGWLSGVNPAHISYEAWVVPPEYTGRPPIYFSGNEALKVPEGSQLVARISGAKDPERPRVITGGRARRLSITALGQDSFEARGIIDQNTVAEWRAGNHRQRWRMTALPDLAPSVEIEETPKADKRDRLSFSYSLEDDYGVKSLDLVMQQLVDDPASQPPDQSVPVTLAGTPKKIEQGSAALDLSKHVWAGKKVSAYLEATDGLGQSARSKIVYFTVPDKIFVEPLAKAVIEQRALVLEGSAPYAPMPTLMRSDWKNAPYFDTFEPEFRINRAPEQIQRAALLIDAITDEPRGLYEDPALYMGLKNILYRLRYAKGQSDLSGTAEDLWEIALRAEFGVLGTALEEMREAEKALRDAMARRAPQREVDTLFERYNEAVDRYREELMRKAIEEGNMAENEGGGEQGINMDQIQELLDAIEEANRLGDTEGARRALAQLAELLENMEVQLSQGGGESSESFEGEMSEEMKEALEELADLLGEQRELKDDTQQAEREMLKEQKNQAQNGQSGQGQGQEQDGGSPGMTAEQLAEQQEALEQMLNQLSEKLEDGEGLGGQQDKEAANQGGGSDEGQKSGGQEGGDQDSVMSLEDALDAARRAMEGSQSALEGGAFADAETAQDEAISALRDMGENLAAQTRQGRGQNADASNNDEEGDPLGRQNGTANPDNFEADIDQRDNAKRSRELLEELRRRASEQDRQQEERDYLERLLNRF